MQTDKVVINKFKACELRERIQYDMCNCGIFSLKVISNNIVELMPFKDVYHYMYR